MAPSAAPSLLCRHVAVIGAGAAGLVAARELRRERHRVVVFERGAGVGGTWVYTADTESDQLGLDPTRKVVHSSLYDSLRTNLPRECMGFLDYPFVATAGGGGDGRRFPSHQEVLRYLEDFVRDFGIWDVVRLRTEVVRVWMEEDGKWAVRSRRIGDGDGGEVTGGGEDEEEVYDGVVVCNGHYTEPRIAEIPGIDMWPGKQMHSHNYRVPDPFRAHVVVVIGSSASAVDISRDIARCAKEVHIANRSEREQTPRKQPGYDHMWLHSMIENAREDGTVVFQDGSSVHVDVIIHCTGYPKAIEIFEAIARHSINNSLLKYSVKGILLNAGICQLCRGDVVGITNALERYQELDPTFSGTREYKLLADLAAAIDEEDVGKFTDCIKEFDSMTRLDPWKTTLLLRAKNTLKAKEDEEDDLT